MSSTHIPELKTKKDKLSSIITDWTEPLYENSWDDDAIANLHDLVIGCWNVGAFPKEERAELWDILVRPVLEEFFNDPQDILKSKLEERVEQRYDQHFDDPRFIINFDWQRHANNQHKLEIQSARMDLDSFRTTMKSNFEKSIPDVRH